MNLQLSLIKKWFDMTKSEVKTEDYREINLYWFKRLVFDSKRTIEYLCISNNDILLAVCKDSFWSTTFVFKPFESNIMTLGYPKNNRFRTYLKPGS